jgi:hypothetical protein
MVLVAQPIDRLERMIAGEIAIDRNDHGLNNQRAD